MTAETTRALLERARRELRHVHALELARLLREAVRRRCDPEARHRRRPAVRWAERMRAELAGWSADGLAAPRALVEPTADRALAFALAAHELDPGLESELCLAFALVRRGRATEARDRFVRALSGRLPQALRRRAERGLAACSETSDSIDPR